MNLLDNIFDYDFCELCKQKLENLCPDCNTVYKDILDKSRYISSCISSTIPNDIIECSIIIGMCKHCFHSHCMDKYKKNGVMCPINYGFWIPSQEIRSRELFSLIKDSKVEKLYNLIDNLKKENNELKKRISYMECYPLISIELIKSYAEDKKISERYAAKLILEDILKYEPTEDELKNLK